MAGHRRLPRDVRLPRRLRPQPAPDGRAGGSTARAGGVRRRGVRTAGAAAGLAAASPASTIRITRVWRQHARWPPAPVEAPPPTLRPSMLRFERDPEAGAAVVGGADVA